MNLYDWQQDILSRNIEHKNYIISAPTNSGKTVIAYNWMNLKDALLNSYRIMYTVPIKALANEKYSELKSIYGDDYIGIETGDIKKEINKPVLVCTQEIYTKKYSRRNSYIKVIMDEFHYIFTAQERSRAYIDGIRFGCTKGHKFLIMSGTLSQPDVLKNYLQEITNETFELYCTDFRPTELQFTNSSFTINEILPYTLIYVFNIHVIKTLVERIALERQQLPLLKRRRIKRLANRFNVDIDNMQELFCGVAQYHSRLTYTQKKFIERLVKNGLIDVIVSTDALGVGVNLPFQWVLFGGTLKKTKYSRKMITKIEFLQMASRAGRKGYFDKGFVGILYHNYNRFEHGDQVRTNYIKLLDQELEPIQIRLYPDIERLINGETTIDKEADYIKNYSYPKLDEYEIQEIRLQLKELVQRIDDMEDHYRELLQKIYVPELGAYMNIKIVEDIFIFLEDFENDLRISAKHIDHIIKLRFNSRDETAERVKELFIALRIARKLNNTYLQTLKKKIHVTDIETISEKIKSLDPMILEFEIDE